MLVPALRRWTLCLGLLTLLSMGGPLACSSIGSQTAIDEATGLLEQATRDGAETQAPAMFWSATAYLDVARRRQGHSDYEGALRFARMARDFASQTFTNIQQVQ